MRIRSIRSLAGWIFVLPALASAAGDTPDEVLEGFLREWTGLRAEFHQAVRDRQGRLLEEQRGGMALQRPGRFRWETREPFRQLIVADGDRLWLYDPGLRQAILRDARRAVRQTPAAILIGETAPREHFRIREVGRQPGADGQERRILELIPRGTSEGIEAVRLVLAGRIGDPAGSGIGGAWSGSRLEWLELVDALGQVTHIEFTAMQKDPVLPDDYFRFLPPEGIDVIDETGS